MLPHVYSGFFVRESHLCDCFVDRLSSDLARERRELLHRRLEEVGSAEVGSLCAGDLHGFCEASAAADVSYDHSALPTCASIGSGVEDYGHVGRVAG